MGQYGPVRRHPLHRNRGQKRRLKPAAMLIRALKIKIRRKLEHGIGLQDAGVGDT